MLETVVTLIMSYIGTNMDDLFVDMIFFAQADTKRKVRAIVLGKYLGIGSLVLVSFFGAYVLHAVPQVYIRLLGLVPIILGVKEWISYRKQMDQEDEEDGPDMAKSLLLQVILVTISNGADNLGVYMPLFAGYSFAQMLTVAVVFGGMIAVWCILSKKLADLPGLRMTLVKHKGWLVPLIYVALGVYIVSG